jgi:hypothetical protein
MARWKRATALFGDDRMGVCRLLAARHGFPQLKSPVNFSIKAVDEGWGKNEG